MKPEQAQFFFDSALRSQFAWRYKAAQLYKVGLRTLESAAAAQEPSKTIFAQGSRHIPPKELEVLEEFRLYEVGFFLIALAIENLIKGVWVGRNHSQITGVTDMRRDLPKLTTHSLAKIAHDAGVHLSKEETELLEALTECIMWSGRYSAPTNLDKYHAYVSNGGIALRFLRGDNILSIELPMPTELDSLIAKLIDELKTIPENQTG
jgi:hypothetical protein